MSRAAGRGVVGAGAVVFLEDRIDHGPGGFDRVVARKERAVAGHRVAEKSLVRGFFSRMFLDQFQLALIADKLGISRAAAKNRAERAYKKLAVHDRAAAVKRARAIRVLP